MLKHLASTIHTEEEEQSWPWTVPRATGNLPLSTTSSRITLRRQVSGHREVTGWHWLKLHIKKHMALFPDSLLLAIILTCFSVNHMRIRNSATQMLNRNATTVLYLNFYNIKFLWEHRRKCMKPGSNITLRNPLNKHVLYCVLVFLPSKYLALGC